MRGERCEAGDLMKACRHQKKREKSREQKHRGPEMKDASRDTGAEWPDANRWWEVVEHTRHDGSERHVPKGWERAPGCASRGEQDRVLDDEVETRWEGLDVPVW